MTCQSLSRLVFVLLVALTTVAQSQVVFYHPDSNATLGASNAFPFNQTTGFTSLHFYTADQLQAAGVAPGAVLTDFAFDAVLGTPASGTYNSPSARMLIGHVLNSDRVPGAWNTTLVNPTIVWDIPNGPYTFPWAGNTWVSLPGFAAAGFTWDGVSDIGVLYTSAAGVTGGINCRTSTTNPRFGVTTFNATTQTPTTTGFFAMKARLTFNGALPQANTPGATLTLNGSGVAAHLFGSETLTLNLTSNTAPFNPFFLLISPGFTGGHVPLTGQSFDLGFAANGFADVLCATPSGFTSFLAGPLLPFANLDGAGNFTIPVPFGCGGQLGKTFIQAGIVDPSHPDGFRISGLPSVDVKAGCRYTSANVFPMAIPDAGPAVTATIVVPPGTIITDLDAVVNVTHGSAGDLNMTLDLNGSPVANLMLAGPADTSDLSGRYQFSDEGLMGIDAGMLASGTTFIAGRFTPDSALSVFDGLDAGGTWTLTVSDTLAGTTGSLLGFSIIINGNE